MFQTWVDRTYAPIAAAWLRTVRRNIEEHEAALVRANRPLDSHPELAAQFDALFDGAEVVPASLVDRFRRLLDESPLEAAGLRVPIAFSQRAQLQRQNRLRDKLYVLLPDRDADKHGDVRVIDESGEDYLYPADWFVAIDVPNAVQTSLLKAS